MDVLNKVYPMIPIIPLSAHSELIDGIFLSYKSKEHGLESKRHILSDLATQTGFWGFLTIDILV